MLPGITGMWQVSGRSDTTFDEYKRLDLYYVDNWSLAHDARIVARRSPPCWPLAAPADVPLAGFEGSSAPNAIVCYRKPRREARE